MPKPMRVLFALAALPLLAACAAPTNVAGFNGDSVIVQSGRNKPDPEVNREAARICQTHSRRAEYASSRQIHAPQYLAPTYEHLYLCLDPRQTPVFSGMISSPIPLPDQSPAR
jgi:hypothetical protein